MRLSVNGEMLCGGKENSCERTPEKGGFHFQLYGFLNLSSAEKFAAACRKNLFDTRLSMWESTLFSGAHGFIGIHEALELRGPEPEAAGFDHGLVLIGIVNPLRQDHACTGLIAVLMRV